MTIELFKNKLKNAPKTIEFSETMRIIEAHYNFFPVAFSNGTLQNKSGQNSGSCKLFAFAKVQVYQNNSFDKIRLFPTRH